MSNKALTWALEQQTGSPTRKLVLLKLADQANDDGYCWPSKETIARHCEIHRKTVQRLIGELADAGYLTIQYRKDGSVNLTNVYQLEMGVGAEDSHGAHSNPKGGAQESRGGSTARRGVGAHESPEPSPQPSREPSKNPHGARAKANGQQLPCPEGVSPEVWADFLQHRKGLKAPLTATAWKRMAPELEKAVEDGWSRDDALAEVMAAGWRGFKAEWLRNRAQKQSAGSSGGGVEDIRSRAQQMAERRQQRLNGSDQ